LPRTINAQEYEAKRSEILKVAQELMYSKGYEQMTIQDILDALQISKGAFYHYFGSKQAVLEALILQMQQEGEQLFRRIVHEPNLPALARLQRSFDVTGRWKTARKDYLLTLLRIWNTDENAILRQKFQSSFVQHLTPLITEVITEAHEEGVVTTPFPDQAGSLVLALILGFGEAVTPLLLARERSAEQLPQAERLVAAYNDALERVLGAPPGALHLMDLLTLHEWFAATP
jgi:AcrR family transcriptional regulator